MRRRQFAILWFLFWCVGGQPSAALAEAAGVHRHESGFGIRLPAGWRAEDNLQDAVLIPAGVESERSRQDHPEHYVITLHDGIGTSGEQQLVKKMSAAYLQGGAQMTVEPRRESVTKGGRRGTVYIWEYRSPGVPTIHGLRIYLTPLASKTFVVLAAGEAPRIRDRDPQLRDLLATADFEPPKMPAGGPLADDTPLAQMWLKKLRGKVIRQFIGGRGVSGHKTHYLAPDGTYATGGTARWKIRESNGAVWLQIWTNDGKVLSLAITSDDKNWYLGGKLAFAANP